LEGFLLLDLFGEFRLEGFAGGEEFYLAREEIVFGAGGGVEVG